jgi:galactokinase
VKHFAPSQEPAEGLGVLLLFRLIEEAMPSFFEPGRPIHISRAPGRLDVMGGLSGGKAPLTLSLPTAEAACAAIQSRDDDLIRLWSPCRDGSRTQMLSVRLGDLGLPTTPLDYQEARAFLVADPRDRWAGYLLGSLLVLAREHALAPEHGAELLIYSDVPNVCGVASSSAVTVAALRAFALQFGLDLPGTEYGRLAQIVERDVLRAHGRVADAMTSALAESGELLALSGGQGDLVARLAIPSGLEFVAIETGTQSIAKADEVVSDDDAQHTRRFQELLGMEPSEANHRELGELMFAAHAEYAAHGQSNEACDLVVDAAKQRRDAGGSVFGAKLSGRGGGGTVVLLGEHGKVWYEALRVKKALKDATGHSGHIFRWSSPGAMSFGSIVLEPKDE